MSLLPEVMSSEESDKEEINKHNTDQSLLAIC